MEKRLFNLGYRDVEVDRSQDRPLILGTNQQLLQEYRVGKLGLIPREKWRNNYGGPTQAPEDWETRLLLLVRLYCLHTTNSPHFTHGMRAFQPYNVTYGVSYYIPLPDTLHEQLQRMIGEGALPTPCGSAPHGHTSWEGAVWSCPQGYQEHKHHFWSEQEAYNFYDTFLCNTPESYWKWRSQGSLKPRYLNRSTSWEYGQLEGGYE